MMPIVTGRDGDVRASFETGTAAREPSLTGRKTCIAIRHVAFEDLGSFEPALIEAGYDVRYVDIGLDDLDGIAPTASDLLVVLGGPIGVYEQHRYPFLKAELRLIRARLQASRPTMGICLGAQLMASALGSKVYPGLEKEIGFAPMELTPEGRASCLAAFERIPVLHWHGDTFDLPAGAVRLASTRACLNQAFAIGRDIIGFQFHPEAGAPGFERWLIGHTVELGATAVDVCSLRETQVSLAAELQRRSHDCIRRWLSEFLG
jgi:GMP synthase (glutamine-hydrolysing)